MFKIHLVVRLFFTTFAPVLKTRPTDITAAVQTGSAFRGKGMMMMVGCFMLAIRGNTTIGGCKSRARNKLHGSAGEI